MGSIASNNISSVGEAHGDGDGERLFKIIGLSADHATPTRMREEIVLLAWLIVLLRTREDSLIRYEWGYHGRDNASPSKLKLRHLSMEEVMTGLDSVVGQVATEIAGRIKADTSNHCSSISSPVSLLLSTGCLSQLSEEPTDEGVLHLEVQFDDDNLKIRPVWYTDNVLEYTVTRYMLGLVDTIRMCLSNPDATIQQCRRPTQDDMDEIWRLNHDLPPSYQLCMHDVISERAQQYSEKVAISSWDGSLTYSQIDQYSTLVACSLRDKGVKLHDFVPVCFEKSRWTIVAVLAVMKAGATLAMMDPTLPLARLQNMATQVDAKTMLTSRKQHELSTSIIPNGEFIVVDEDTFKNLPDIKTLPKLPAVPSSALMYLIFTSGSTGTPKGVKISHETYTSSAFPRAKAVGYTENSRVLDFASYAFDVSIDSMLLTVANGGCLCIPSDEDRLNDINAVMRNMQVNYAGITPSMARVLDPDVIASLSGLGLGGEAASASDVNLWGQQTRIIIGYGPCECTIGCTVNSSAATGRDYISIGPGNGAAIWIVDPNDHDALMPIGAVGELLVEGPIVGQGYLNDPDKTAAAFIQDPPWLVAGHKSYAGRQGRLYKTGDLGKYDPDGSGGIVFAGRKDTQVKLRGQRVELGEIESQLRARLPAETGVIAEVIVPQGYGSQPTLVAFIAAQSLPGLDQGDLQSAELPTELSNTLSEANANLAKVVPRYMVPNVYIPVNYIPTLISGKTDRKRLRQFGATVDLRQLDQGQATSTTRELSDLEQRLRQAWGQVLKLDPETIRPDDNFFGLGGESLTAMRLVSVCRGQGLELSVINTFSHPTLSTMAGVVGLCDSQEQQQLPTFSMISQTVETACLEASHVCGTEADAIEDIYPCTPTQESLFTFSLKATKAYVAQRQASIPSHITLDAWKKAWEDVVSASPILRTRLAQLQDPGLQQVVLKERIAWRYSTDLKTYLETDRKEKMDLGQSLARYAIVDDQSDGKRYMVWTVHHVLYDGWSEPLILKHISNALQEQPTELQAQMRGFVKYVRDTDADAMHEFWRRELDGAVGPQFPRLPSRDFLPTPDSLVEHYIPLEIGTGSPFTMATLIRGAWALVASQYTGSGDVVFGETLTGRDISLPGVDSIIGPLIATVPVRICVHRASTVESYLQTVQRGTLSRTPYQHMGMQNIRKVSHDAQYACEAGTGLVIQPEPEYLGSELGFDAGDVVQEALHFNPYPLMLACGIRKGGFRICASFDGSLIKVNQMRRILVQLEVACLQLTKSLSRKLDEISCLPTAELDQIWQWNQSPPLSIDESSKTLRVDAGLKPGSVYPPAVVPWVCNPHNPSLLSPIGSIGQLWLEGPLLSNETMESPAWLVAGSSTIAGRTGTVHPTGDMVQWYDDGSLVFVGRKEDVVPVNGHAVNIAEVEAHLAEHLPSTTRASAAVLQPLSDKTEGVPQPELVVFIEQQPSAEEFIKLMPVHYDITVDENLRTTICNTVPVNLAIALKKLDKFMRDSLPSYMVPSAYVVTDMMPKGVQQGLLNQLASKIPPQILTQLSTGFKTAWAQGSTKTQLTTTESILQSAWAKILRLSTTQIDVDDNFFRLGGDSVLAMKLVSSLRAQGHILTVADIFQHMRLADAAKVLKLGQVSTNRAKPYRPFSTMGYVEVDQFLSKVVQPKLADSNWTIRDVSPVTDSQAMDIRATIQVPRTSIQYTMLYFNHGIEREKLLHACRKLVQTHEILRTVFIEHNSKFFQVVVDQLDAVVDMHQTDGDIQQYVTDLCTKHIESNFPLGSSFLSMLHVEGTDGRECLIIGLSHALYDGMSLPRLLKDLEALYTGHEIVDFEPFSSYIAQVRDERAHANALKYWRDLLDGSSLSILGGTSARPTDKSIFRTKSVDVSKPPENITTANLLTAAWALVLARHLRTSDVTFGGVTSGRNIDLSNVENIMGPCYQIAPIRVPFESQWTATDLLRFVQMQSAASAAHDYLGFEKISTHCTQWPSERFFNSIVHHQDWDDFDTMPFAEGTCRVDILNPHGDAADPLKVVSFVRDGQMQVGLVGAEQDAAVVDAALEELVVAVQELAMPSRRNLLSDDAFSENVRR
ncbi:hypothetical protein EYZ11_008907 [Aspergillus tanneri]|uniref:Nonribosomal peptide synthetases (NRPS) n=1 Tax=Aspergillus tanneri TaxID=1220188 RepID=A0A4S3J986_9EURO|nr:Nonribosomal peptide synthetases (NRPS) [Aspergillus tanneri]KAA8643828.1 Nonribosomal peptide synthetases (NRPS) [Aspergillus tanneri]THC91623.1 hypothetical protein EYZ11_008907 [Aspergillus tanneri]